MLNGITWNGTVFMLNWIVWDRTVFKSVYKQKPVLILNWIVWNRTVYMFKMDFALITYNCWCAIKPHPNQIKYKLFSNRFIWPIDMTLTVTTILGQSWSESKRTGNSTCPTAPEMKPHHWMQFNAIASSEM